jgi:DNA-directed RNA polymerase subunit RPC12/RpoP
LGGGKQIETCGYNLCRDFILGDIKSWKKMCEYNKQDVWLLEDVYNKLKHWAKNHPNLFLDFNSGNQKTCTTCGSTNVIKNGSYHTNLQIYKKYKCNDCGSHLKDGIGQLDKEQTKNILRKV